MMPIVFWASLAPWPRLKAAAEPSCSTRKRPVDAIEVAGCLCTIHITSDDQR